MVDTRKTILVIEDHIDTAEMLVTYLSLLDYVCLLANSRDMALAMLETHGEPDCIVMDWFMPGMVAPVFMEVLQNRHPTVPVLAVSAAPHLADKVVKLKVDRHLVKPYTIEDLSAGITACIGLRKKRQNNGI